MKNGKIIIPQKQLTKSETHRLYKSTIQALKNMSIRCQLAACELQRVDPKNDIFDIREGVFDKEHLYAIRKALKTGEYDVNRDIARIN